MDVSHLDTVVELGTFLDNLEERPETLIVSEDMAKGIVGSMESSHIAPVNDIRFRSILCTVKEDYEHKD